MTNKQRQKAEQRAERERRRTFCPRNHNKNIVGRSKTGRCLQCERERTLVSAAPTAEAKQRVRDRQRKGEMIRKCRLYQVQNVRGSYDYQEVVYGATHCALCNQPYAPGDRRSLDHIVPLSLGGADTRSNVQSAHFSCNTRKGNRVKEKTPKPI